MNTPSSKKQFSYFIAMFFIAITGISCFNILMNPFGYFGKEQFSYSKIFHDRQSKLDWVLNMNDQPQAFVLGSSNSMRMLPDSLEALTGLKSFNFGMFQARVEDFYAVSNALVHELGTPPKLIFFCIDDWNFAKVPSPSDEVFQGAEKRLAYKPQLSQYLDDYSVVSLRWAQFKSSLTADHFEESIRAFKTEVSEGWDFTYDITPMTYTFYADGVRKRYGSINGEGWDLTDTCESGNFNTTEYLKKVDSTLKLFPKTSNGLITGNQENFQKYSKRRLELFDKTIELLEENGVLVVFNVMPIQPYFKSIVERETNYQERKRKLMVYLNQLKEEHGNVIGIRDNSDISHFGGFENHFFDTIHPTSVNSCLMMRTFSDIFSNNAL